MTNRDVQTAWKYHEGTKHSYWSVRSNTHFLDWANRPLPFKIYPAIEAIALPRDVPQTGVAALAAISEQVRAAAMWSLTSGIWRASSFSRRGLPSSANIRAEKSIFARRPAPERSTRSS